MGIFDLAAWSRAQNNHISEFTEFSAKKLEMSNLIMPSPFICFRKYFHTFFQKKLLGLSKAIGGFESPYLVMENVSVPSISLEVLE